MSPDLAFWLALAVKTAVTAAFVVTASLVAERAGSVLGGLVATLPLSAGPSYVFLSLDHDAAFIAASALASLAVNAGATIYVLVYILMAQTRGTALSLAASLAPWLAFTVLVEHVEWTLAGVVALNAATYLVVVPIARRFGSVRLRPAVPRWFDMPLRAGMVAALVTCVVITSRHVGPFIAGVLAVFPVVLTSLILIFQPRIGGRATAALIANTMSGLVGFAVALVVLHLAAVPLGLPLALTLALSTSIGWNLALWAASPMRMRRGVR